MDLSLDLDHTPEKMFLNGRRIESVPGWLQDLTPGRPDLPVLDLACGKGAQLEMLRIEAEAFVVGIDLEEDPVIGKTALPQAAKRVQGAEQIEHENISLVQGNIHRLPFADDSFSLVWCANVMHYPTVDLRGVVAEASRVTAFGGYLVVRGPFQRRGFTNLGFRKVPVISPNGEYWVKSLGTFDRKLKAAGFELTCHGAVRTLSHDSATQAVQSFTERVDRLSARGHADLTAAKKWDQSRIDTTIYDYEDLVVYRMARDGSKASTLVK
jgi:ubiquinone/menaquinone biosynthesis C-methylase UbiE